MLCGFFIMCIFFTVVYDKLVTVLRSITNDYIFLYRVRKSKKKYMVRAEFFHLKRAYCGIQKLLDSYEFSSILDVGCGDGQHCEMFKLYQKKVTAIDYGNSTYFQKNSGMIKAVVGDYNKHTFCRKFDCVWVSHVLEHQVNAHLFLKKVCEDLKENGVLAITVPPLKFNIVGGHVNLFNSGLLLYRLILAGFDCNDAKLLEYSNNITVLVRKKRIDIDDRIVYDSGDIKMLKKYFPQAIQKSISDGDSFNGDIEEINWC